MIELLKKIKAFEKKGEPFLNIGSWMSEFEKAERDYQNLERWKGLGRHAHKMRRKAEADNKRLKEYVQHKSGCNYSPEYLTNQPCTCGLELKDQS